MNMIRFLIVLCWICLLGDVQAAIGGNDTLRCRFYFPEGSSGADLTYRNNKARLDSLLKEVEVRQRHSVLRQVIISCGASPEGVSAENEKLSNSRVKALRTLVRESLNISELIIEERSLGENWKGLAAIVIKSDMPFRREVFGIIRDTPEWVVVDGRVIDSRKKQLKDLNGGSVWRYMQTHFFAELGETGIIECVFEPNHSMADEDYIIYKEIFE